MNLQTKQSLSEYLIENYFSNVSQVEKAIKLGIVLVNNKTVKRVGIEVNPTADNIKVIGDGKIFVSRGGYKLQKALEVFDLSVKDLVCMDVGASTGGFTDCLLQKGAKKIYAIDTGYGQLDWTLRKNEKVKCIEKTNIRYLLSENLYEEDDEKASFIVIDVSFISVIKLLPAIQKLSAGPDLTQMVVLIKPQFEAGKNKVARGGVIRNPEIHFEVLLEFIHSIYRAGLDLKGLNFSPILGASGNIEFLAHLIYPQRGHFINPNLETWIKKVIKIAYEDLY